MRAVVAALSSVSRRFDGPPPVDALVSVDLQVGAGEHVAVVGPSGSGKSTLLSILGLLDRPTSGSYEFDGIDTRDLGERETAAVRATRIGFVFQAFHLLAHRSVEDNVALGTLYTGLTRPERRRRATESLGRVGMGHRRRQLAATLSGGERQRVAIARAVSARPALLLCDEPTGNLDRDNSLVVLELLQELHADGMTIVTITHDASVAARADRVLQLHDGRLLQGPAGAR